MIKLKKWFKSLSIKQKQGIFFVIVVSFIGTFLAGMLKPQEEKYSALDFQYTNTISFNAHKLGVTGKNFAKELGLDISVSKNTPVKELGVSKKTFDHSVEHLIGHKDATLKYYIYFFVSLFAVFFLVLFGNPAGSFQKPAHRYPAVVYILTLIVSVTLAGFWLGKSPNPMEGIVKVFKTMVGLYPDPLIKMSAFVFFMILAVIGNKVICGWACPFGALEELIYMIPAFKKIKKHKVPFVLSHTIRGLFFVFMLLFLFHIIGPKKGFVIYHYLNPFNLFNYDFETISIFLVVTLSLIGSLFIYRPFCMFICPFGFISWIFEKLSFFKIRIRHDLCTNCGICEKACPTGAVSGMIKKKPVVADCFSCMRCLKVCPEDAVKYKGPEKKETN